MEARKKATFGGYKSNKKHENHVIGNTREGQGYADKRKRKIVSRYKKLMRKTRLNEAHVDNEHPSKQPSMNQTEEKDKEKTTHYRKSEQRRNTQSVYNKDKMQRGGRRKQSEKIKKGFNRYSDTERIRQKQVQEHHKQLQEKAARRKSREEALKKHREKKEATHKKLSKRTARGQPVIKYQMEYLLQKIQSQNQ
ncbi:thyroid transcription factor 1-associated protein 26 homolog [Asterias rubens]|uniref:thyroid transcription factor 1-associated protein 26 homolog n=1 Tax=Asterias rubens TaxID=7604 RepID=UPI001455CFC4|nr:thyroid transcription factor 1-associated protein 26 homolog [Asterias rubens]